MKLKEKVTLSTISFVFVLLLGAAGVSHAASDAAAARQAYSDGYIWFQKGRYQKALRYFRRAYRKSPQDKSSKKFRSAMLYFIGVCYYRLGKWKAARPPLIRYTRSGLGKAQMLKKARAILRKLRKKQERNAPPAPRVVYRRPPPKRRIPSVPKGRGITRRPPLPKRRTPPLTRRPHPPRKVAVRPPPKKDSAIVGPSRSVKQRRATPSPPVRKVALRTPHTKRPPARPDAQRPPTTRSKTRARVALVLRKPPSASQGRGPSIFSYILLGLGVAALGTGTVFGILALQNDSKSEDIYDNNGPNDGVPAKSISDLKYQAEDHALISYITIGTGGALAVTGLILLFTTGKKTKSPAKQATLPLETIRGAGVYLF